MDGWMVQMRVLAHVGCRVLHKDGGLGVALAHLLLPLLEAHQHVVRHNDRLKAHFLGAGILPAT